VSAPEPVTPLTPKHGATATAWAIEAKVWASTAATFAVSLVLAVLNAVQDDHALLGSTPAALQAVIIAVLPTAITFLGGYYAKHTPRGPSAS
jgi:hypothetical protein